MKLPEIGVVLMAAAVVASGCESPANATLAPAKGEQYIIGLDLSASRSIQDIRDSRQLIDNLIDSTVKNGDQFVLVEMYGGTNAADHQWIGAVPPLHNSASATAADKMRLADFRIVAHQEVGLFFDTLRARKIPDTDVFNTVVRSAGFARGSQGRHTTLILLSDMVHSTPGLRMDYPQNIPSLGWVEGLKRQNRLPDVQGVCVFVSGAETSTARGARLRDFWISYLTAAGAKMPLVNYQTFIPNASELRCQNSP